MQGSTKKENRVFRSGMLGRTDGHKADSNVIHMQGHVSQPHFLKVIVDLTCQGERRSETAVSQLSRDEI